MDILLVCGIAGIVVAAGILVIRFTPPKPLELPEPKLVHRFNLRPRAQRKNKPFDWEASCPDLKE